MARLRDARDFIRNVAAPGGALCYRDLLQVEALFHVLDSFAAVHELTAWKIAAEPPSHRPSSFQFSQHRRRAPRAAPVRPT